MYRRDSVNYMFYLYPTRAPGSDVKPTRTRTKQNNKMSPSEKLPAASRPPSPSEHVDHSWKNLSNLCKMDATVPAMSVRPLVPPGRTPAQRRYSATHHEPGNYSACQRTDTIHAPQLHTSPSSYLFACSRSASTSSAFLPLTNKTTQKRSCDMKLSRNDARHDKCSYTGQSLRCFMPSSPERPSSSSSAKKYTSWS